MIVMPPFINTVLLKDPEVHVESLSHRSSKTRRGLGSYSDQHFHFISGESVIKNSSELRGDGIGRVGGRRKREEIWGYMCM